ncbi:MAG: DUF3179 domain-containing protein [Rubrivivax sp.]
MTQLLALGRTRAVLLGWAAAFCMVPALAAGPDPGDTNGFDVGNASVPLSAIQRGGPPKDGIPAIDQPKFVGADQAGFLKDGDRVLGLVLGGEPRAYPVRILNWHEVVNDRFGKRAVLVSYCPLCGTGMAFEASDVAGDGRFGVSGLLYNSDVLLYDRATHSLWSQIIATAISGPRKGARLQALPMTHTTWADWRRRHPKTRVLSDDTGFGRDYDRDPYAAYANVPQLMFDVAHRDDRFPTKEWVLGIEVDGVAKAYPFSRLARAVNAHGELADRVNGKTVHIRFDAGSGSAEAFDAQRRALPATMAYWFAWVAFHPRTEVLSAP